MDAWAHLGQAMKTLILGLLLVQIFPVITINDMVNAQYNLLDHFGIDKLFSIAGGSMGGMQVLQFISNFPDKAKTVIPIACTSSHSAQNIAFNELGRLSLIHI